jgi:hypothetical protein
MKLMSGLVVVQPKSWVAYWQIWRSMCNCCVLPIKPQVAAQSDQHLLVKKQQTDPASSTIIELDEEQRMQSLHECQAGLKLMRRPYNMPNNYASSNSNTVKSFQSQFPVLIANYFSAINH